MTSPFYLRDSIAIENFSASDLMHLVEQTLTLKKTSSTKALQGKVIASCFFEASTRTRLSFEAAVLKAGGHVIGFDSAATTSSGQKGESLADTARILSQYADALVIRHPQEGAAYEASLTATVPVINAGDGANQHPTQTFLDLVSIFETQKRLNDLHLVVAGDLKYGRTVHSLVQALSLFGCSFAFVAPGGLHLPEILQKQLALTGCPCSYHTQLTSDLMQSADIVYMTRFQQERFDANESNALIHPFRLDMPLLTHVKPTLKVLHPLPRRDEIPPEIDDTPYAYYFQQAENGLYTRQALLALTLQGALD